jgi:hypothetical protein
MAWLLMSRVARMLFDRLNKATRGFQFVSPAESSDCRFSVGSLMSVGTVHRFGVFVFLHRLKPFSTPVSDRANIYLM